MIHLITGKPRSGKTYLAVKTLSDFFTYDVDADYWLLKDDFKEFRIITNIEGLSLPHENLNDLCEKMKISVSVFFTKPIQDKISQKHKFIIYALDEAQQFFPDNFRDNNTRYYFEYHGHYGHTIYILTQDKYRIWRGLASLAEFETRAVKKSLSFFGEIKYNEISSGEIVGRKVLKPSQKIYDLYQSEKIRQPFKQKIPIKKFILIPLVLTIIAGVWMIKQFSGWISPTKKISAQMTSSKNDNLPHPSNQTGVVYSNPYQNKLRITLDSILMDNKPHLIRHPITNELVPVSHMPYELHFDGRNLFAYMDSIQFAQYIEAKHQQEQKNVDQSSEGAPRSRPIGAGLPWGGGF